MRREAVRRLEHRLAPGFDLPPVIEQRDGGYFYKGEAITEAEIDDIVSGLNIKPGAPDIVEIDLREDDSTQVTEQNLKGAQ